MSAHFLLNLLNELRKSFIATSSINELKKFTNTNVRFYLSHGIICNAK